MPAPIASPESLEVMPFPLHGLNLVAEFERQPAGTSVQAQNVRSFDLFEQRARGGSRSGLVKYLPLQVAGVSAKIQHVNIIVDPTEDALVSGFFDPNDPDGLIDDPSTNNRKVRNPHRKVRRHGSGKGLNLHLNGLKIKGLKGGGGGGTATIVFIAFIRAALGGPVLGLQTDGGQAGPGTPYNKTLTVNYSNGTVNVTFTVTASATVDAAGHSLTQGVTVTPGPTSGFIGFGNLTITPI